MGPRRFAPCRMDESRGVFFGGAMTPRDVYLSKTALRILEAAGIQGVAWMEQVGITAQMPLTTAEQAALIDRLERNAWVQSYRDPIRDLVRYVLSGPGHLALGAL